VVSFDGVLPLRLSPRGKTAKGNKCHLHHPHLPLVYVAYFRDPKSIDGPDFFSARGCIWLPFVPVSLLEMWLLPTKDDGDAWTNK